MPPEPSPTEAQAASDPRVDLDMRPSEVLRAVEQAAEIWGAEWSRDGDGGLLELPVQAGLRRGLVRSQVAVEALATGSRLKLRTEECVYELMGAHLVVLLMGALGGLVLVVSPFHPPLLPLIPVAGLLLLAAWFLVAAQVRHRGPEEFLRLVTSLEEDASLQRDE